MAIINLAAEFGAGIIGNNSMVTGSGAAVRFSSLSSAGVVLQLDRAVLGTPTTPLVTFDIGSTASVPAIQLLGQSFVSATTIAFTTGAVNGTGGIRVLYPDGVTYGWIPVLPSATLTGAARG